MKSSEFRVLSSELEWLPDMDLNHDKVIQSHLCYRYTIGHAGASAKLKGFTGQSRRQTRVGQLAANVYARPHPRGEGEIVPALGQELYVRSVNKVAEVCSTNGECNNGFKISPSRDRVLPLLRVRTSLSTKFSKSRFTRHASRATHHVS
jgi:hypothetical protein